jgi:hypothetical protein
MSSNYTHEETRRMIAGALYDFAAYLTGQPCHNMLSGCGFKIGAEYDAAPIADALKKWAELRGNTAAWLDHADVQDWNHILLSSEHPSAQSDRLAKVILQLCPDRIVEGKSACDIAADVIKERYA